MTPVRRAQWQSVQLDSGWALRLVDPDGNVVLTSRVYPTQNKVEEAFAITLNSSVAVLRHLDERSRNDG